MKLDCRFETSAVSLDRCPRWAREEIAFVGRSNVGKSSLINAFTGIAGLARISRTPGRTQALNFFTLDRGPQLGRALVDLPGYGYARMPAKQAEAVGSLMRGYLDERANLRALVMLVEVRREPEEEERELAELAHRRGLLLLVAASKCDKINRAQRALAQRRLGELGAEVIFTSVLSGEGVEALQKRLLRPGLLSGARVEDTMP